MSFFDSKMRFLICVASFAILGDSYSNLNAAQPYYQIDDKEEAFLVRRIAEFWKDQDYGMVKSQIISFLSKYPKSKINDHLRGILADLYLQENTYEDALSMYSLIQSPQINEKIILNKLQCMYELNFFDAMIASGSPYLTKNNAEIEERKDEFRFLMGEAFFRASLLEENKSKKIEYLSKSEPLYESVLTSSFSDPSMFALAEIYRTKKDFVKANKFYSALAESHPERREDLLFHAALAQSEFDRALAIKTFSEIVSKGGPKAQDASLNNLILLFQEDRYKEVINAYPSMISSVANEKKSLLNYMIGRSYFALEDYKNSSDWLKQYVFASSEPTLELRNALLMQLNSAKNLKDEFLYQETMMKLQTAFPKDAELPQAIFVHAIMLKEKDDYNSALVKLEDILENHPNFDSPESLLLEYSIISHQAKNWEKSHKALTQYLKKYPNSNHANSAWKYLLSSGINLLKEKDAGLDTSYSRENFYDDLKKILATKDALSEKERQECLLLQGKMGYELGRYNEAIKTLNSYLSTYTNDATLSEAHLITALCHNKQKSDLKLFTEHAEAALKGNPKLENRSAIHLELYNTYLSLISNAAPNSKTQAKDKELYQLAADHLYSALEDKQINVKTENKLWLANYYYDKSAKLPELFELDGSKADEKTNPIYQKSKHILENILTIENDKLKNISKDQTYLEWEILKLANMRGREGMLDKKIELLKSLIEEQTNHPDWNFKLQKEALVELAKAYDLAGKKENSYETYKFVVDHYKKESNFASLYANLHALRMKFANMSSEEKREDNAEVTKILSDLKELQIRKSAASEPLHLEAALEYAWIRVQLAKEDEKAFKYLFFLNRIKEDFNDKDDPMCISYHKALKENSQKAKIYETYIQFVDAEIQRCNASFAEVEGKSSKANEFNNKAKDILTNFAKENDSYYYLKVRSNLSLAALKKSKIH
jgi:TolA-binding protein